MIALYLLVLLASGIYTYSQIDLNLTLLQTSWFLNFQHSMIQLGYFNRPFSTGIFIFLTTVLSIFYLYFIHKSQQINSKNLQLLLVGLGILGLFSYPAFSHDIFNYIFDARTLVFHHANPYTSTALMFPTDTWTRFMQWTHRTYPYGPTFLPITIPVYLLGWGKFFLTLLWFKSLMVLSYLGSALIIFKLAKTRGAILFALNPLVIYEGLVAGHLDIVMLFWALLSYFLFVRRKNWLGLTSLIISIGVKYATALFLPIYLFPKFFKRFQLQALIFLAFLEAFLQIGTRELLPHYFLVPFGFTALWPVNKKLIWSLALFSFLLLLIRYLPFLYTGNWWEINLLNLFKFS